MRASQFLKKTPADVLCCDKAMAAACAKAHEENKSLRLSIWNDRSKTTSDFRLRPLGFYLEAVLDEKGKPTGKQIVLAGAVCYWDWQRKCWNEEKEREQAVPLWCILGVEILDEPARPAVAVPAGYKLCFPVTANGLRSQKPALLPVMIAQRALKSKEWAEAPTLDVLE